MAESDPTLPHHAQLRDARPDSHADAESRARVTAVSPAHEIDAALRG